MFPGQVKGLTTKAGDLYEDSIEAQVGFENVVSRDVVLASLTWQIGAGLGS